MKVAYIINPTTGTNGANSSFLQTLKGLMAKGVEPFVVAPDRGAFIDVLNGIGVKTYVVDYRPATYPNGFDSWKDYALFIPRLFGRIVLNTVATKKITEIIRNEAPDVIHTNIGVMDVGFRASRKLNIPHVFHVREYGDLDFGYHYFPTKSLFRRRLHAKSSYSICITKDIQHHHRQQDNPASQVIYDAVCDERPEMPIGEGRDYLFYAGRIQATKGLDILLRAYLAYTRNSDTPMPLYVAGSVGNEQYYEAQLRFVQDNNLQNVVKFLGARDDIEELMRNARATIIPSLNEGFGRVMPEAMFNGCPVIAYDFAGSHEQIQNGLQLIGENIAFGYNTEDELAALISKVVSMADNEIDTMRKRAFKTVNTLYTTETNSSKIYQLYKKILKIK